jgi:hypothetical protein
MGAAKSVRCGRDARAHGLRTSNNLGSLLRHVGDLEGARAQLERALEISEAALGPDHPGVATVRSNLNSVLQALQEATPDGPTPAV